MILEEGKAGIPLIVVVGLIFFVQVNVVLGHHIIPKRGSKVFGILAGFACIGFIFPDWQTAYLLGVAVLVLVALVPIQAMFKVKRKSRRS
jgi:ABC-type dipeptide/oligopeptide/nickel transport system permease component